MTVMKIKEIRMKMQVRNLMKKKDLKSNFLETMPKIYSNTCIESLITYRTWRTLRKENSL